jgi:hypothetical protein
LPTPRDNAAKFKRQAIGATQRRLVLAEKVSPVETLQQLVDEDELVEVAESLGWLQLSAEGWDKCGGVRYDFEGAH